MILHVALSNYERYIQVGVGLRNWAHQLGLFVEIELIAQYYFVRPYAQKVFISPA